MTAAGSGEIGAPLLEVDHLTMRFGGLVAIDDVSFVAGDREITAIIGPNGAGKTTVFNCLTGFYKPTVGRLGLHHPAKGLFHKLETAGRIRKLFTPEEIEVAVSEPPARTRAYFRGKSVRKYGESLVAANWDSLVFDSGEETLKRVPMMEPLRGTKELVAELLDRSEDAASLLRALGENDE